jgi:hypothetical protein
LKSIADRTLLLSRTIEDVAAADLEADKHIDRAAAVILASQVAGAEKEVEAAIKSQIEWVRNHSTTKELRDLVYAQISLERMVERVGEFLPARFATLLNLAGETELETVFLKQLLNSSPAKSPEPDGTGS